MNGVEKQFIKISIISSKQNVIDMNLKLSNYQCCYIATVLGTILTQRESSLVSMHTGILETATDHSRISDVYR